MTGIVEYPTVLVRLSPELVAQLTADGWEFGEPDADGFYSPTVYTSPRRMVITQQAIEDVDSQVLARIDDR